MWFLVMYVVWVPFHSCLVHINACITVPSGHLQNIHRQPCSHTTREIISCLLENLTLNNRIQLKSRKTINIRSPCIILKSLLSVSFKCILHKFQGNRESVVGIETCYGLHNREVGVRVPVVSRISSSPSCPDLLWGPPNLQSNGYRYLFPWG
jgi:hypothetical protein